MRATATFTPTLIIALAAAWPVAAQQPQLLGRELFFDDPEVSASQLSPDGKFMTFLRPMNGVRNIWIKYVDDPFSASRPLSRSTKRPIPSYFWTHDSKHILFVQDKDGDENYNVYSIDPAASNPEARNLTNTSGAATVIYGLPKADPDTLLIGLNDRDKAWHDLYKLSLSTGKKTLLRQNTGRMSGWFFDLAGSLRMASRVNVNGDTELLRVDPDGCKVIYSCSVFEECEILRFHRDGKRVYIKSNAGTGVDLSGLYLLEVSTGKTELVELDPQRKVDFGGAVFSTVNDALVATSYTADRTRLQFRDKTWEADYKLLRQRFAGKEVATTSCAADESRCLVSVFSDTDPGTVYLFDRGTKQTALQYRLREQLSREALAPMESICYKSSDGLEISAYLTIPRGAALPLPLVVVPHGGPWLRDSWRYHPVVQFLANRGYAVLQPNFRGSAGFGKKFLNAGNGKWGETMQDDITFGVKHLIANGTVDPKRVGIMGASYGGYATLAGMAFTPSLYAAGVAIVAPSNLLTLLDSIPPYWESARKTMHTRMADPSTPEGRAKLSRQSPLNAATRIQSPLMVVQGANDPRVSRAESDQIVLALRDRQFPVEYLVAPDEGHGFRRPVNNMALYLAAESFFARHLGGRAQTSASPEVTRRLAEITVDPGTVTLQKKADLRAITSERAPMKPGVSNYAVSVTIRSQKIEMSMTASIQEEAAGWVATETLHTPAGELVDRAVLSKENLQVLRRFVTLPTSTLEFEVKEGKVVGTSTSKNESHPLQLDLQKPLFADGAGCLQVLATLPLAAGYRTEFQNFDVRKLIVKTINLEAIGRESVSVPAGTFDAWKVALVSPTEADDSMYVWIDVQSRKHLKTTATISVPGGAELTAVLQPEP